MRVIIILFAALIASVFPTAAQTILQMAENKVPVAMIKVIREPQHTEIHLETKAALKGVCWYFQGANSPYLVSEGRRFRFTDGEKITDCPQGRDYAVGETMVLRFQPLPATAREFSFVEGEGGENQMSDPAAHRNQTFWNFLRVKAN